MAEETLWGPKEIAGVLGACIASFLLAFRKTRSSADGDLHARMEQAERKNAELERAMKEAITTVERLDSQVLSFERRLDRSDIRQADHRNEVMEELRVCRDALTAVVERLTTALGNQRRGEQQQAG